MIYRKIPLLESHPEAMLTCYISEDDPVLKMPPRPAMIVCPGGGYEFLSPREAEPIAKAYFAAGMNVFVLSYTVGANAKLGFLPLTELSLAICLALRGILRGPGARVRHRLLGRRTSCRICGGAVEPSRRAGSHRGLPRRARGRL